MQFLEKAVTFDNLYELATAYRGLNIEKLKNKIKTYSARLNKKYRIDFEVEEEMIIKIFEITILKIHPHKYQ